jgi:hypothetical protein
VGRARSLPTHVCGPALDAVSFHLPLHRCLAQFMALATMRGRPCIDDATPGARGQGGGAFAGGPPNALDAVVTLAARAALPCLRKSSLGLVPAQQRAVATGDNVDDFLRLAMEHPLRVFVAAAQIQQRMWRRSGDAPGYLAYCHRVVCNVDLQADLVLLQLAALRLCAADFLSALVERYGVAFELCVTREERAQTPSSPWASPADPRIMGAPERVALLEAMLFLLLAVLSERGLLTDDEERRARDDIVAKLALRDMTHRCGAPPPPPLPSPLSPGGVEGQCRALEANGAGFVPTVACPLSTPPPQRAPAESVQLLPARSHMGDHACGRVRIP